MMCIFSWSRYFNFRPLRFAFGRFALARFDARLSRFVSRYEASVSAEVDMVFFAKVVFIEQALADARNAHKKSLASWFLNFMRVQWFMASIWFQLGSLPGRVSLSGWFSMGLFGV